MVDTNRCKNIIVLELAKSDASRYLKSSGLVRHIKRDCAEIKRKHLNEHETNHMLSVNYTISTVDKVNYDLSLTP